MIIAVGAAVRAIPGNGADWAVLIDRRAEAGIALS
jgi:hypothetical protein